MVAKAKRHPIRNVDGRIIGEVVGRDFTKRVRQSIHMLHEPEGWASDVKALKDAEKLGASRIVLLDTETKRVYHTTIARMLTEGIKVNRGYGEQVVLPLHRWTFTDRHQPVLFKE